MAANDLVLALTGASGAPYGLRLLEALLTAGRTVHFSISPSAVQVLEQETGHRVDLDRFEPAALIGPAAAKRLDSVLGALRYCHYQDFSSGIASGSFLTAGMVVCPCSMGTVAAIANGLSQNLIQRAADVHLKERRTLVLTPRETPLGLVQLRNLTACVEAGAIVLPAMPAFYTRPQSIDDMIQFIVGRICDQLNVPHRLLRRWGSASEP